MSDFGASSSGGGGGGGKKRKEPELPTDGSVVSASSSTTIVLKIGGSSSSSKADVVMKNADDVNEEDEDEYGGNVDDDDDEEEVEEELEDESHSKSLVKGKVNKAGELLDFSSDEEEYDDENEGIGYVAPERNYRGSGYELKPDHESRPLWVTEDHHIFLETHSPYFKQAQDFLVAIAEPINRPRMIHEYKYSEHSLFAAVSIGLDTEHIISRLNLLSKTKLHPSVERYIKECTANFGKVKLVLRQNNFLLELTEDVYEKVTENEAVKEAKIDIDETLLASISASKLNLNVQKSSSNNPAALLESAPLEDLRLDEDLVEVEEENEKRRLVAIKPELVQNVKRSLAMMNHGALEEYDFKNDDDTPALNIEMKLGTVIWQHQEKGLAKMFSHGRARSGMIVLPCGAGKTLVGVTACAHMKRSCIVLCSTGVAVSQWKEQFRLWTQISMDEIFCFTRKSSSATEVPTIGNLVITTYSMIAHTRNRSQMATKIMEIIKERQWGLILLDEVHVFPTNQIRTVLNHVHSHCKLGLTATLVREDHRIADLNFLIGPKLYEANWQDLAKEGYLARVQCYEVWCPMAPIFFREYLKEQSAHQRRTLGFLNPNKFVVCKALIEKHEKKGDKVIVFMDDLSVLHTYSDLLKRPEIFGGMSDDKRKEVLDKFKALRGGTTIFFSTVGDAAIDLPEASVVIQVASHYGSRRQEAQRMGRILRRKATGAIDGSANSWFYSLVSKDTQEMYFGTKRQQFLVDQGYAYYVLEDIKDESGGSVFNSLPQDVEKQLMVTATRVRDDRTNKAANKGNEVAKTTRRKTGDMGMLSNGNDIIYGERKIVRNKLFRDQFEKKK